MLEEHIEEHLDKLSSSYVLSMPTLLEKVDIEDDMSSSSLPS